MNTKKELSAVNSRLNMICRMRDKTDEDDPSRLLELHIREGILCDRQYVLMHVLKKFKQGT